jgi:hypothetical protein
MASADFSQFVVTTDSTLRFHLPVRPPRVSAITFPSYIRHIYTMGFGQYRTSLCLASSSVPQMPYMWFLFVRPRVCLRLPSDSASRRTPLPSANSSYCQACRGLSPPSYRTCRAHEKQCRQRFSAGTVKLCLFTSSCRLNFAPSGALLYV